MARFIHKLNALAGQSSFMESDLSSASVVTYHFRKCCHVKCICVLFSGALAMESLHRQVLPFLLRRLKEDVLQDLPPKIIQDYYCELSPLQVGNL